MEFVFYISAAIAVLATCRVITHTSPFHALVYLIVSLLAVSAVFFSLGAYFAGALEVIVYAGAIMVMFVFVVMLLNLGKTVIDQERSWLQPDAWIGPAIMAFILLITLVFGIIQLDGQTINVQLVSAKQVGMSLFSTYLLAVELISMLLLAGLVVAYHIGRDNKEADEQAEAEQLEEQK